MRTALKTAALIVATAVAATAAHAEIQIKVGRSSTAVIFELPAYVAMEKGFFKQEGLAATFVPLAPRALVTAGIAGAIDFSPESRGGAQAALKGAEIRFVAGQSSQAQWVVAVSPFVTEVTDLKGKYIAFGRPGTPGFDEGNFVLRRSYNFQAGRDYKRLTFTTASDRIAALEKGEVHGAVLSVAHAAKAGVAGFPNFIPSGQGAPELNGAFWVRKNYLDNNREAVAGFIRALTTATHYISLNGDGTTDIIQKYFNIKKRGEASHFWRAIRDMYSPVIHTNLLTALFDERRQRMIRKGLWPKRMPVPDVERFVARKLLTATLRDMRFNLDTAARPN